MQFLAELTRADLSPATVRGYRYDLRHFLRWHHGVTEAPFAPQGLAEYDLIAYRQEMIAAGRRPATINRRLEALRRLGRWAYGTGALAADVVRNIRPVRTVRNRRRAGLTDREVHALLGAAGASRHGLAPRNYALVQLMLQTGVRVGEVAGLPVANVTINERSGSVRIRQGKGIKAREVPLKATARRAPDLSRHPGIDGQGRTALSQHRAEAMPVRSIQAVIAGLARRARLKRSRFPPTHCATPLPSAICTTIPASSSKWRGYSVYVARYHGRLHAAVERRPGRRSRALAPQCRPLTDPSGSPSAAAAPSPATRARMNSHSIGACRRSICGR